MDYRIWDICYSRCSSGGNRRGDSKEDVDQRQHALVAFFFPFLWCELAFLDHDFGLVCLCGARTVFRKKKKPWEGHCVGSTL